MTKLAKSEKDQRIADDLLAGYSVRKIARIRGVGNNRIQEVRDSLGGDLDVGDQDRSGQYQDQDDQAAESEIEGDEFEDDVRTGLGNRPFINLKNFSQQEPSIVETVEPVSELQLKIEQNEIRRLEDRNERFLQSEIDRMMAEDEAEIQKTREEIRRIRGY